MRALESARRRRICTYFPEGVVLFYPHPLARVCCVPTRVQLDAKPSGMSECPKRFEFLGEKTVDGESRRFYRERESDQLFDMLTPQFVTDKGRMPTAREVSRRVDQRHQHVVDTLKAKELKYPSTNAYLNAKREYNRGAAHPLELSSVCYPALSPVKPSKKRGEDAERDHQLMLYAVEQTEVKSMLEKAMQKAASDEASRRVDRQRQKGEYLRATTTTRAVDGFVQKWTAIAERDKSHAMNTMHAISSHGAGQEEGEKAAEGEEEEDSHGEEVEEEQPCEPPPLVTSVLPTEPPTEPAGTRWGVLLGGFSDAPAPTAAAAMPPPGTMGGMMGRDDLLGDFSDAPAPANTAAMPPPGTMMMGDMIGDDLLSLLDAPAQAISVVHADILSPERAAPSSPAQPQDPSEPEPKLSSLELEAKVAEEQAQSARLEQTMTKLTEAQHCEEKQLRAEAEEKVEYYCHSYYCHSYYGHSDYGHNYRARLCGYAGAPLCTRTRGTVYLLTHLPWAGPAVRLAVR